MNDTVREAIRRERCRKGWSQRDLAERAGLSPTTVNNFETGLTAARLQTAYALAAPLDLDIDPLLDTQAAS